jgi:sec-independent protein translocase protein TatB
MLDIGWPELVVIGAVALVAVGPKDLPKVMHTLGRMAGKARRAMNRLHDHIEHLSYEAERASETPPASKPETEKTDRDRDS